MNHEDGRYGQADSANYGRFCVNLKRGARSLGVPVKAFYDGVLRNEQPALRVVDWDAADRVGPFVPFEWRNVRIGF